MGERFGVSKSEYDALVKFLGDAGLKVKTFPNRLYVEGEGTAQQVGKLLGISMVDVDISDGIVDTEGDAQQFRSFRGTPSLPSNLAGLVTASLGLDTRHRFHHRLVAQNQDTFGPQDLRRFYDIDALHALGYGGQLSKVAAIGTIPNANNTVNPVEVNYFYQAASDSTAQFVIDQLPLGSSQADGEPGLKIELEMDAEMSTVAAPQEQSVTLVLVPPDTLFTSGLNEINNNMPDTTSVSISFGTCELVENDANFNPDTGEIVAVEDLVAEGAAEGISYFSASGDYGVLTCLPDGQTGGVPNQTLNTYADTPSVDFPSGVPYMTAVGGTMYTGTFDANGAITTYGNETTWNEQQQIGGGGGVSILFNKPPWQYAVLGAAVDGGMREVPDMALLADTNPGVAIVAGSAVISPQGNGTSDAAPMAAGMFALINDVIGGCRFGGVNPNLYALATAQYTGGASVLHDITTGDISMIDLQNVLVPGPAAQVGYDEATGVGSLDVAALAQAWPSCLVGTPTGGGITTFDGGYVWDGGVVGWDGGFGLDAGARSAYDPCSLLDCGVTPGATCVTTPEGPASCQVPCDPNGTNTCVTGDYCAAQLDGDGGIDGGICAIGCSGDSDCADAGQVCGLCAHTCIRPGSPDAGIGQACTMRANCPTGGQCLRASFGFPGGYCTQACSTGPNCSCPTGSECLGSGGSGFCYTTCSVAAQDCSRNAAGYVCQPLDTTDVGACLPQCGTDADCQSEFATLTSCDTTTHYCVAPSSSSSGSSSGSTGSSASGSSNGASTVSASSSSGSVTASSTGSTGTGSNTGSSTGSVSSSNSTSSSASTGTSAGTNSTSASSTGSTSGTHSSSASGTTSGNGSTGTTSGTAAKKGCGCGTGAGLEANASFLLVMLSWAVRRRRR